MDSLFFKIKLFFMETVTLATLTEKLKYAPHSVLEKIWGYADALLENKELHFALSEAQKQQLVKQNKTSIEQCIDAEAVYQQLKQKYEL